MTHLTPHPACSRRRLAIKPSAHSVTADLEDDQHHFSVTLNHDGDTILSAAAETIRYPWTTCRGAGAYLLAMLRNQSLYTVASGLADNSRLHCTHMFDLAVHAAAHAQDHADSVFDIVVPDRENNRTRPEVYLNGECVLTWEQQGDTIISPGPFEGLNLRQLSRWIDDIPAPLREPVQIMRRALMVAGGRTIDVSTLTRADNFENLKGACYTYQPAHLDSALRMQDSYFDFSTTPEALLKQNAEKPD